MEGWGVVCSPLGDGVGWFIHHFQLGEESGSWISLLAAVLGASMCVCVGGGGMHMCLPNY